MLSPLFIQLFGRDAIERLSGAGLETPEAIVGAGAAGAAAAAGIDPDLARRIVAFAAENTGSRPADRPAGRRGRSPGGASRRAGGRRKAPRPAAATAIAPAADPSAAGADAADAPWGDAPDADFDLLVDEASLVSWMGLAARGGGGLVPAFSVADEILDPGPRDAEGVPRAGDGIAPPAEPPGVTPARGDAVTLEGTFWSFGRGPRGTRPVAPSVAKPEEGSADPATAAKPRVDRGGGVPRRRSGDGH